MFGVVFFCFRNVVLGWCFNRGWDVARFDPSCIVQRVLGDAPLLAIFGLGARVASYVSATMSYIILGISRVQLGFVAGRVAFYPCFQGRSCVVVRICWWECLCKIVAIDGVYVIICSALDIVGISYVFLWVYAMLVGYCSLLVFEEMTRGIFFCRLHQMA